LKEGDRVQVTLEVVDTESNRVLWRDTSTAAMNNLIGLREQISQHLRQGLFPVLGAASGAPADATRPQNAEAYDLYLRSAAFGYDPEPNRQALPMLEKSVALDPSYAPAWEALARRFYMDGTYGKGGSPAIEKARADFGRALEIDPQLISAATWLAGLQVEGGDLGGALEKSSELVQRRPDAAVAHFNFGYVLRYAGLLEDSARECDQALALDPRNAAWRSCAATFSFLGKYDRAIEYTRLDGASQWAATIEMDIRLRQGQREQALLLLPKARGGPAETMQPCLSGSPSAAAEKWRTALPRLLAGRDPEPKYYQATQAAFCNQNEVALQLLRSSIEGNFLAYPGMDKDPLLAGIRSNPEFGRIRALAVERQKQVVEPWKAKWQGKS
jgi:Tfp pilus assembly protein PilF